MDFITGYDKNQPFLLYLAFHAPHDTRNAPPEYHTMYPPEMIKLPINFLQNYPFDNGDLYIRDEKLAPFPRTEECELACIPIPESVTGKSWPTL